ncbi:hypothetical protein OF363_00090 [Mycoplasma enhydrae]|uniref:hypothetical protein n=1 Tax=Mycoplasma enhydrae TaxID=2499220 RepID=UPI0021E7992A|nr:hypothetical protein [Mycoplasma enhydrae]MCV3733447.1 hypothetical protein [Mycoplasma enhydrae]
MKENINTQENSVPKPEILKTKKTKFYFFLKDKAFIWTIVSFALVFFIVISFLNVRGLTTMHSYTFGMFFGMFSIVIYALLLLLALKKIFKMKNTYSVGVFHFSLWRISIIIVTLILLGTSIYYTKYKPDTFTFRDALSKIMSKWYLDFKESKAAPENVVLLPNKWTPGSIFSLFYVLFAFPGKTAGMVTSYIFPIILFCLAFATLFVSDKRFKKIFRIKNKTNKAESKDHLQKNINANLDKQLNINKNANLKEEIKIDSSEIALNQQKEQQHQQELNKRIIIDEPDFSTQEFEAALKTEMKENKSYFNKDEQNPVANYKVTNEFINIEEEPNFQKKLNTPSKEDISIASSKLNTSEVQNVNSFSYHNNIEDISFDEQFEEEDLEVQLDQQPEPTKAKNPQESKRFSIIEDKEKLF